ncbi:unnamed protein product, partial [Medioppia subpectinata]
MSKLCITVSSVPMFSSSLKRIERPVSATLRIVCLKAHMIESNTNLNCVGGMLRRAWKQWVTTCCNRRKKLLRALLVLELKAQNIFDNREEPHPDLSIARPNRFGASLGYETFYASFFPLWFWNIDSAVGRRLVLVWVIVMYFGQALKDVIQWPRPHSPPVVVLEPEYAVEYGMPSTHAMVGSALPVSLVIFTLNRYEYSLWVGIVFAIFWCVLVCGSRLYLGMHSVIDIIAGLLLTAFLMIIIIPLVDAIDQFHLTSPYSPFITIPLIVFLATVYPKSDRWSPARGDTCIIMGAGSGILL